jgi:hypothetical protein
MFISRFPVILWLPHRACLGAIRSYFRSIGLRGEVCCTSIFLHHKPSSDMQLACVSANADKAVAKPLLIPHHFEGCAISTSRSQAFEDRELDVTDCKTTDRSGKSLLHAIAWNVSLVIEVPLDVCMLCGQAKRVKAAQ